MPSKFVRFHLYRYQLLPKDRYYQPPLFADGPATVEELIEQKNFIFYEALKAGAFKPKRTELMAQNLLDKDDFLLYRVASNRSLNRETREFSIESLENWPKILVAIWNHPDMQLIAIQHRTAAFQDTKAVANIIFESTEAFLSQKQLKATYEPIFEMQKFWDIARIYENRIQEVEFEIITPNMANISGVLPENLIEFAKHANSHRNKIAIEAEAGTHLHIEQGDKTLDGLVNYSSKGGGNVSVRVTGLKKRVTTSKTVKEAEIDELEFATNPDKIAEIIKELMR